MTESSAFRTENVDAMVDYLCDTYDAAESTITCPCGSTDLRRAGKRYRNEEVRYMFLCKSCGKVGLSDRPVPVHARPVRQCGTRGGANRHRELGEVVCESCLGAERAHNRTRYWAQKENP